MEDQSLLGLNSSRSKKPNINIWLIIMSTISIYFTGVHGLPLLLLPIGPFFKAHLANAILVSWLCVFNLLFVPSMGNKFRKLHKITGTAALITGTLSTILGFITVWYERYQGVSIFAITISFGGTAQVYGQIMAIKYIRQGKRLLHIKANHGAFYAGCLIPAFIRLPQLLHFHAITNWTIIAWIIPLIISRLAFSATIRKTWY